MSEKIQNENTDPIWKTHMEMLMKRKRIIEIADEIDRVLFKYYFEKGMEVPPWKRKRDPQWWIDYLKELDEE